MSNLLTELKKEMSETIQQLDNGNVHTTKKKVDNYFKLASVMLEMFDSETEETVESSVEVPAKEEVEEEKISVKTSRIDSLADMFEEQKEVKGSRLDRKLKGGLLENSSPANTIFVPESIIKEKGFEDGDIIHAEPIPSSNPFKTLYDFTLVEKAEGSTNSLRETFDYGIVEYDETLKRHYVERDMNGELLRIDGSPQRFMISEKEEKDFRIETGGAVDIAWYKGNFNKGGIAWRYSLYETKEKPTISEKQLSFKQTNAAEKSETKEETPQTLTGKTICLVGVEPYHAEYKSLIESHGGNLIALTSESNKNTMASSIRKSDLVMVGISHTGHSASQYANKKAKLHQVPFKAFSGFGKASFLAIVYQQLEVMDKGE